MTRPTILQRRVTWLAASLALVPGAALAQKLGGAPAADVSWIRVAAALLLCLGLAVGAAFALRTRMRGSLPAIKGSSQRLRLIQSLRLSHQVDVCLVGFDETEVLLAASPQGAVLISVRAGGAEGPSPT